MAEWSVWARSRWQIVNSSNFFLILMKNDFVEVLWNNFLSNGFGIFFPFQYILQTAVWVSIYLTTISSLHHHQIPKIITWFHFKFFIFIKRSLERIEYSRTSYTNEVLYLLLMSGVLSLWRKKMCTLKLSPAYSVCKQFHIPVNGHIY